MKLAVEAFSGYKANERPLRFQLGGRWREVQEVVDRWYGPGHSYFRVRAEDGWYVLRVDEGTGEWTLVGYRE